MAFLSPYTQSRGNVPLKPAEFCSAEIPELTAADAEGTALLVHGEVLQVHHAARLDGQALRVEHATVREQPGMRKKKLLTCTQ